MMVLEVNGIAWCEGGYHAIRSPGLQVGAPETDVFFFFTKMPGLQCKGKLFFLSYFFPWGLLGGFGRTILPSGIRISQYFG